MTASLELWPIGNCQVSGLVDRAGRFVWGCVPRVDGEPVFSSLLDDKPKGGAEGTRGFWEIDLENGVKTEQYYAPASRMQMGWRRCAAHARFQPYPLYSRRHGPAPEHDCAHRLGGG